MKKLWAKYKWILLILINTLPFLLNGIFYITGGLDDIYLFIPIFALLSFLNFKNCNKILHYICLQIYILLCSVCCGYVTTYLYYHNISNDSLTPIVGMVIVLFQCAINLIVTAITATVKMAKIKKLNEQ